MTPAEIFDGIDLALSFADALIAADLARGWAAMQGGGAS